MPRRREIEGDLIMGWPDRKRPEPEIRKDEQGRVFHVRSPFWDLQGLITPTDLRYTVFQMQGTDPIHPDDWSLSIDGLVERPVKFDFEEIQKFPARVVRNVSECAGSEAGFFAYIKDGGEKPDRYGYEVTGAGLVSSGEWVGVSLATVLERAGVKPEAISVRAEGFDRGRPREHVLLAGGEELEEDINFDKCLPLEKVLDPDTILAWALNGEYIRHVHGGPVRLIVPGWTGNWSIKWLQRLEVLDYMAPCYYQTEYFYYADSPDDPNRVMMTSMGVKTIITDPRDEDSPLPKGTHIVKGMAWSGCGLITRVEISVDGGSTWSDASLEANPDKWLWVRWAYTWDAQKPGKHSILARATDETGRVQPQTPWNYQLKLFDGLVPVEVEIE